MPSVHRCFGGRDCLRVQGRREKKISACFLLGFLFDTVDEGTVARVLAGSEAKQSIKEGRDRQLLLPLADLKVHWKKAKKSFTVFVKTAKGTEEKITLKGTTGMARLRGSMR
jgi:hypothetical protein